MARIGNSPVEALALSETEPILWAFLLFLQA